MFQGSSKAKEWGRAEWGGHSPGPARLKSLHADFSQGSGQRAGEKRHHHRNDCTCATARMDRHGVLTQLLPSNVESLEKSIKKLNISIFLLERVRAGWAGLQHAPPAPAQAVTPGQKDAGPSSHGEVPFVFPFFFFPFVFLEGGGKVRWGAGEGKGYSQVGMGWDGVVRDDGPRACPFALPRWCCW